MTIGKLTNEDGIVINTAGTFIDTAGLLINTAGTLINAAGNLINEGGAWINEDCIFQMAIQWTWQFYQHRLHFDHTDVNLTEEARTLDQ